MKMTKEIVLYDERENLYGEKDDMKDTLHNYTIVKAILMPYKNDQKLRISDIYHSELEGTPYWYSGDENQNVFLDFDTENTQKLAKELECEVDNLLDTLRDIFSSSDPLKDIQNFCENNDIESTLNSDITDEMIF